MRRAESGHTLLDVLERISTAKRPDEYWFRPMYLSGSGLGFHIRKDGRIGFMTSDSPSFPNIETLLGVWEVVSMSTIQEEQKRKTAQGVARNPLREILDATEGESP